MRKTLFLTEEGFFHLKNPPQKTPISPSNTFWRL